MNDLQESGLREAVRILIAAHSDLVCNLPEGIIQGSPLMGVLSKISDAQSWIEDVLKSSE